MPRYSPLRVAVIATDGFEESELTEPVRVLKDAGASVEILSLKPGEIQGFRHHEKGTKVAVDRSLDAVSPEDYDALVLPGGALNADALRVEPQVQAFVRSMQQHNRPMAIICHAPWILISAGLVTGRRLTSYHTIADDVRNAGGQWLDAEVIVDGNWVTSRQPGDLGAFNRELLNMLPTLQKTFST